MKKIDANGEIQQIVEGREKILRTSFIFHLSWMKL